MTTGGDCGCLDPAIGAIAAGPPQARRAAATSAAVTTLASQAAVSLINNQGDIGKTLQDLGSKESVKQLVTSMLTAGITQGVTSAFNLSTGTQLANASFTDRFATYATKAAVSAGVQSAVYGTPLSETAKTALINSLAQSLTSQIGDWGKGGRSDRRQGGGPCRGAMRRRQRAEQGLRLRRPRRCQVAEAISPLLDKLDDRTKAAGFQQSIGSSIAGMGAMLAASLTGKDPLTALNAAQMVDNYNRQLHPDEAKRINAKIAGQNAEKQGISLEKAVAELTQQVEQNIDTAWDKRLGSDNPAAQAFLKELPGTASARTLDRFGDRPNLSAVHCRCRTA